MDLPSIDGQESICSYIFNIDKQGRQINQQTNQLLNKQTNSFKPLDIVYHFAVNVKIFLAKNTVQ